MMSMLISVSKPPLHSSELTLKQTLLKGSGLTSAVSRFVQAHPSRLSESQYPTPLLSLAQQATHRALGERLLQQGYYDDALTVFIRLIQSNAFDATHWYGLALSYDKLQHLPEALRAYRMTVRLDSTFIEARFAIAVIHEEADELTEAMQGYADILELCPTYVPAQNNLASCALQVGHYQLAERYFQHVLNDSPTLSKAMLGLALAKDGLGKEAQALWWYRNYLAKKPDSHHRVFVESRMVDLAL
jgi:tetratricopeptide (TPR) repeat protein